MVRGLGVTLGLLLGVLIGAGLAFASNESDFQSFQQTVQREAAEQEQRDTAYKAQQYRHEAEQSREQQEKFQRGFDQNRSYSLVSPYQNGGRPQACTTNGQDTYCQ